MRVGLACPYSWDFPGGVQVHVRDLTEVLLSRGHEVSVLAPTDGLQPLPAYVVPAGRSVPVPYNGAVAHVAFGPPSALRTRRWLRTGCFDVLHVHEPAAPSVSLLALWAAEGPVVATFHAAATRSPAMRSAHRVLEPALRKLDARIAVSAAARDTLVSAHGGSPVLIPNGVRVDRFAAATRRGRWSSPAGTVSFLGRLNEPRKGLAVLLAAWPGVCSARPGTRLLVAGRGDIGDACRDLPAHVRPSVSFLGELGEADKAALLASTDLYVAPQTGGESFGIVLLEAMAAGAPVLASDLPAFRAVLDGGRLGALTPAGDPGALTRDILALLSDAQRRETLRAAGAAAVRRYDWDVVAGEVLGVYERVRAATGRLP